MSLARNRNFWFLRIGDAVSNAGDQIQFVALSWLVAQLPHPEAKLGIVGMCQFVPRLLFGIVGGVMVDRFDRRLMFAISQIGGMLQAIAFAVLVATSRITFAEIVGLTIIGGIFNTLNQASRAVLLPSILSPQDLRRGVAIELMQRNVVTVVAPALAGALLAWVGTTACFVANAASFVVPVGLLPFISWRFTVRASKKPMSGELTDGFRYVAANDAIWAPMLMVQAIVVLPMACVRLMPILVTRLLGGAAGAYGVLMTTLGVGHLIGSTIAASWGVGPRAFRTIVVSSLATPLLISAFAWTGHLWLSVIFFGAACCAHMLARSTAIASVQGDLDDAHRGRVMSLFGLDTAWKALGSVVVGFLAGATGPSLAISGLAALAFLVGMSVAARVASRRARAAI